MRPLRARCASVVNSSAKLEPMMDSTSDSSWVCAQCGAISPTEVTECPNCSETGGVIRLNSSAVRRLWETTPSNASAEEIRKSVPFFGRFRDLEFVGKGGMGKVYKAFDPLLDRVVALKFIHGEDPELRRRLLLEARAQAKLEHENVCKVYEVGEEEGKLYIAMQYVRGKTLVEAVHGMSLPQKIGVVIAVAEAIHEAHRMGMIHRDLKPANIMVEQDQDGQWVPYITDFGLARALDTTGMTLTGMVVGSPHYMSPEQAKGEINNLDRRSDVYSLGATLYEVLCGKRPFDEESSVQLLLKVIHQEPIPLKKREPSLPSDLETITMKCLEKAPDRRYESSKAFAQDLRRYMDGEPILARRASPFYRLRKKIVKNKTAAVVVAVSILLVLFAIAASLRSRWELQRQALLAQRMSLEVQQISTILRNAHTMPLHDISRERGMVLERMKLIESQSREAGAAGYGPCHYALGYGYLALQDYDRAKQNLEQAWKSGFREPSVAYALGQALGNLYDRELMRVEYLTSGKETRLKEVQKTYRDPALEYLKLAQGIPGEPPSYIEGLIAFYDGRYNEALQKAAQAAREVPWLYEARDLEGDIYVLLGTHDTDSGAYDRAASEFDSAGRAYGTAIQMARSDASLYVSECARWVSMMELGLERGNASEESFRNAVDSCDKGLLAFPRYGEALDKKAWAYWRWGEYQSGIGQDPTPVITTAIQLGEKAVELNPKSLDAWMRVGASYNTLGEYQTEHEIDPRAMLEKAIEASKSMIAIDPNYPYAFNIQAYAAVTIGEYEIKIGQDPRRSLQLAISGFKKAIQFDPHFSKAYNNLGYTYMTQGLFEMGHGMNPNAAFDKAVKGFQQATRVNPGYSSAFTNLSLTLVRKAQYQLDHGQNPEAVVGQAMDSCRHSLQLNDQSAFSYNVLGLLYLLSGEYEMTQGRNPTASLDRGMQSVEKALEIKPDAENISLNLIRGSILRGTYLLLQGNDPAEAIHHARQVLKGLKRTSPVIVRELAVDALEAKWMVAAGKSPESMLTQASEAARDLTQDADAWELLAELHVQSAEWKAKRGEDATTIIESGLQLVNRSLQINPELGKAYAQKGLLLQLRSRQTGSASDRTDSRANLTMALQKNSNLRYLYE